MSGSGGATAEAEDPPVLTGSEEITTAANKAIAAATRAGADEVTVVALDDAGRLSIEPVPLADAVDVALATAESLDLVAIEPPSYAKALETPAADPDVDQQWAMSAFPVQRAVAVRAGRRHHGGRRRLRRPGRSSRSRRPGPPGRRS